MTSPQAHEDARSAYTARLTALEAEHIQLRRGDRRFGVAKLIAAAAVFVCGIWLAREYPRLLGWALVPAAAFLLLWTLHERLLRRLRATARLADFYRGGMARLDNTWAGQGDDGLRFLDQKHLYARDLDLFGKGSLYERICQAASAPGQHALAGGLLQPVSPEGITERQAAVRELTPRLDLRERLALAADAIHTGVPGVLIGWAESREDSVPGWLRYAGPLLALLWLAALGWWLTTGAYYWILFFSFANATMAARAAGRARQAAEQVMPIVPLLAPLARVLAVYEREPFHAPLLERLTAALASAGMPPSRVVARLVRSLDWLISGENWFVKLMGRFVFWTPLCMLAIESWRRRHGPQMRAWLESVGGFEALSSLASFAYERPDCTYPVIREGPALFDAAGLKHPLLPAERAVANDVRLDRESALIIVSGPNMAGKSTLLRAIGLNAVLAQYGAPVPCDSLTLAPLTVGASITVEDSLQSGLSRFYAEIQRLKQITDLAGQQPTLFLLDELLSGTNSHDRRVGTEALLRGLLARGAIGLITTHDLALTEIAPALGQGAANVHFGDRFDRGALRFDYKLTPGIANSTNALELMRSIGLEV